MADKQMMEKYGKIDSIEGSTVVEKDQTDQSPRTELK